MRFLGHDKWPVDFVRDHQHVEVQSKSRHGLQLSTAEDASRRIVRVAQQVGTSSLLECRLEALQIQLPTVYRILQRHGHNPSFGTANRGVERWVHRGVDDDALPRGRERPKDFCHPDMTSGISTRASELTPQSNF